MLLIHSTITAHCSQYSAVITGHTDAEVLIRVWPILFVYFFLHPRKLAPIVQVRRHAVNIDPNASDFLGDLVTCDLFFQDHFDYTRLVVMIPLIGNETHMLRHAK